MPGKPKDPLATSDAERNALRDALPPRVPPWLRTLVRLMDDALIVPGTRIRIGWDAIVGLFVPFAGDAVSALSHLGLLWTAFRHRVPKVVIARMVLNAGIDIVTGAVPLVGDVFDLAFRANRKNLELLERAQAAGPGAKARPSDYLVVGGAMLVVLLAMLVPLFLAGWLVAWVSRQF